MTTCYPLARRGWFDDLNALCRQTGIDLHTAERYVFDARRPASSGESASLV